MIQFFALLSVCSFTYQEQLIVRGVVMSQVRLFARAVALPCVYSLVMIGCGGDPPIGDSAAPALEQDQGAEGADDMRMETMERLDMGAPGGAPDMRRVDLGGQVEPADMSSFEPDMRSEPDMRPADPSGPRSAGCGLAAEPGFTCFDEMFEGNMRQWCVNIPDGYDPDRAYDVVIGLHGCGGNNRAVHNHRAPMEEAGADEFLFIYPQARGSCWDYSADPTAGSDISWIMHMMDETRAMACVNTDRTFVHGMSSGGSMSPYVIDAGVAIAFASASAGGRARAPTPAWYYAGTTDGYFGQISSSISSQRQLNGCSDETVAIPDSPCVQYQGCTAPVTYCEDGRGHVWPKEDWAQGGILDFFRAVR